MERRTLALVIEKLEQSDELLSAELNRFTIRPRNIKAARDLLQEALNDLEEEEVQPKTKETQEQLR